MKRVNAGSFIIAVAVAALILVPAGSALAQTTPGSNVELVCGTAYWGSYSEYVQGLLSVDYNVGNTGTGPAYNTTITSATALPNNVTVATIVPIWSGDLAAGDWETFTFKWEVPTGVQRFRTKMSICNDCCGSICVDGLNGGVDIKPGSCPNSININSQGNMVVGVYSYGLFDARTLDLGSVVFAGASAVDQSISTQDINGDGLLDAVFHFRTRDINLQVGDTRACLSGDVTGGGTFRSCDMVRVISN